MDWLRVDRLGIDKHSPLRHHWLSRLPRTHSDPEGSVTLLRVPADAYAPSHDLGPCPLSAPPTLSVEHAWHWHVLRLASRTHSDKPKTVKAK